RVGMNEANVSIVIYVPKSPSLQSVTSDLTEAARVAFSPTASKGLETLNENLQNRTATLREDSGSDEEQASGSENETESNQAEPQEAEESEDSEEASADAEATESGGR